jgi:hypothetical protein
VGEDEGQALTLSHRHTRAAPSAGSSSQRDSEVSMPKAQSFENHAKFVPLFHGLILPVFLINFISSVYWLYAVRSWASLLNVLMAFALIVLAFYARIFALTVQDRVIRLEMRLRMSRCLPSDLQTQIDRFTVAQLVALRFAADDELPELAARVLRENLHDKKTIKKMIRNWQADHQRA